MEQWHTRLLGLSFGFQFRWKNKNTSPRPPITDDIAPSTRHPATTTTHHHQHHHHPPPPVPNEHHHKHHHHHHHQQPNTRHFPKHRKAGPCMSLYRLVEQPLKACCLIQRPVQAAVPDASSSCITNDRVVFLIKAHTVEDMGWIQG